MNILEVKQQKTNDIFPEKKSIASLLIKEAHELSQEEKKKLVYPELKRIREERAKLKDKAVKLITKQEFFDKAIKWHEKYMEWVKLPFSIQKNSETRFHQLVEFMVANDELIEEVSKEKKLDKFPIDKAIPFIIEHDWAKAFKKANISNEFKLPYDVCAFEFIINNAPLIVCAEQFEDGNIKYSHFVKFNNDLCITTANC